MNLHLKQRLYRSRSPTGIRLSAPNTSVNLVKVLNLKIKRVSSDLALLIIIVVTIGHIRLTPSANVINCRKRLIRIVQNGNPNGLEL